MRREESPKQEVLSWTDVDALIDQLLPQVTGVFDSLVHDHARRDHSGRVDRRSAEYQAYFDGGGRIPIRHGAAPARLAHFHSNFRTMKSRVDGVSWWWTTCGRMDGTL